MRRGWMRWLPLLGVLALACDSGAPEPEATREPAPRPPRAPSPKAEPPKLIKSFKKQGDIGWGTAVNWRSWDEGLKEAQKTGKSICVVVYADWCGKCRKLAPAFSKPELVAASKDLVMVLQDAEDEPEWLTTRLDKYGRYVPRIFFMDSAGNLREELKSSHPRYPYFYAASQVPVLMQRMKEAAKGGS